VGFQTLSVEVFLLRHLHGGFHIDEASLHGALYVWQARVGALGNTLYNPSHTLACFRVVHVVALRECYSMGWFPSSDITI